MDCIFCKIIAGEIPSTKVYEDGQIIAFRDIAPVAPVHVLVIPKAHIESVAGITGDHAGLMGHIWTKIPEIAKAEGLNQFRIVTNTGADANQTVNHLHFHIVGGRKLATAFG